MLLQVSSNVAQGPFQGYVPDLVAAPQVGLASGMVGLFTVLGVVTGTSLATIGVATGDFVLPTIAMGVVHLATMVLLVFRLHEGRAAKDRGGRCWRSIAPGRGAPTSCANAAFSIWSLALLHPRR